MEECGTTGGEQTSCSMLIPRWTGYRELYFNIYANLPVLQVLLMTERTHHQLSLFLAISPLPLLSAIYRRC